MRQPILLAIAAAALIAVNGCAVRDGQMRKVTAWGIWTVVAGNPLGIGYWHSEIGPAEQIKSEISDKPALPR
jgi:hypothetical protein